MYFTWSSHYVQESGGDVKFLRKFLDLGKDDVIETWDKASTVYAADSDDEEVAKGKQDAGEARCQGWSQGVRGR